nr:hypothetical protein CFP56_38964 [Quercus suber]
MLRTSGSIITKLSSMSHQLPHSCLTGNRQSWKDADRWEQDALSWNLQVFPAFGKTSTGGSRILLGCSEQEEINGILPAPGSSIEQQEERQRYGLFR